MNGGFLYLYFGIALFICGLIAVPILSMTVMSVPKISEQSKTVANVIFLILSTIFVLGGVAGVALGMALTS